MIRFIVKHRVYFIWLLVVAVLVTLKGCFFQKALWHPAPAPASEPSAQTSHTLSKNHQLTTSDLVDANKKDTFLGRHLLLPKSDKEKILLNEISPLPQIVPAPDSAILLLPLTKEEATLCQWLQKGSLIILCRTDSTERAKPTDCYGPICVAAAHSNTPQAPGDFLFLQVPISQVWKINSYLAASKRSILLLPPKGQ